MKNLALAAAVGLIFSSVWSLVGCDYYDVKNTSPTVTATKTTISSRNGIIDFETVKAAVFRPHCFKCHSGTTTEGKVDLDVYANVAAHLYEIGASLDIDDMPRKAPALPDELKAIVYAWIANGAPETAEPLSPNQSSIESPIEGATR